MPFQITINLIIAFMWMLLTESYSGSSFIIGYIIGILMLLVLDRLVPGRFYGIRALKIIQLILLFIKELIISNLDIVKLVYKPKLDDIEPGIFAMRTELKSAWEITLLANLITLTPGTLSIAVSEDNQTIYIHAIDIDDIEASIQSIKNTFEKAIMEVTR